MIGFIVFVLKEGLNQNKPGESQNTENPNAKPCAWGSMFARGVAFSDVLREEFYRQVVALLLPSLLLCPQG